MKSRRLMGSLHADATERVEAITGSRGDASRQNRMLDFGLGQDRPMQLDNCMSAVSPIASIGTIICRVAKCH
jgi:hypothetical protein